jgi:hypothetical protein
MAVFKPAQSEDDCFADSTPAISLADTFQYIGKLGGEESCDTGVRFINVTIPKDATILTAIVTFQAQQNQVGVTCNATIKGELSATPAIFSTYDDFWARTRTTHTVPWNNIPTWTINTDYDTPDVSPIIQEQVNQVAWASGDNLVLFFENNGSGFGKYRVAKTYDQSITNCAGLTVTWSVPGQPAYQPWAQMSPILAQ